MARRKYYLFPTLKPNGSLNPYLEDFSNALFKENVDVINASKRADYAVVDLLKNSFKADVYIFNWIEDIPFRRMGNIQTLLFILVIFPILKLRKVKIYWVFHNFTAHKGIKFLSTFLRSLMMKYSDAIITHSKEAFNYLEKYSSPKIKKIFVNHPVKNRVIKSQETEKLYDILIWGSIEPYKGILEFLRLLNSRKTSLRVKIIGRCKDVMYEKKIISMTSLYITYENRIIPFDELGSLISISKFVVFPYLKQSVSSSGALMDTISFGGTAIGPDIGSFKDLSDAKVCYTYNSYMDVLDIISSKPAISIQKIEDFISHNTWDIFASKVIML